MPGIPQCATPVGASMSLRVGEPATCPIMATVVLYLRGELRLPLDTGMPTPFCPVSRYFLASQESRINPTRTKAVRVSPRRNACHVSPLKLGMISVPITTATATRLDEIKNFHAEIHTGAVDIPSWGGDVAFPN